MEDGAGERAGPGPVPGPYHTYYPSLFAFFLSLTSSEYEATLLCSRVVSSRWEEEHESLHPTRRKIELFRAARRAVRSKAWRAAAAARWSNGPEAGTDQLTKAVRLLPALEQEAISLAFDAGLTCGEIGEVLSLAEREAAHLIVRALRRLKGELRHT